MPVPPLHHGIDCAAVDGVGSHIERTGGNSQIVDNMQQRYSQNKAAVKPVGHINMLHFTLGDGAEKHNGVSHPN